MELFRRLFIFVFSLYLSVIIVTSVWHTFIPVLHSNIFLGNHCSLGNKLLGCVANGLFVFVIVCGGLSSLVFSSNGKCTTHTHNTHTNTTHTTYNVFTPQHAQHNTHATTTHAPQHMPSTHTHNTCTSTHHTHNANTCASTHTTTHAPHMFTTQHNTTHAPQHTQHNTTPTHTSQHHTRTTTHTIHTSTPQPTASMTDREFAPFSNSKFT